LNKFDVREKLDAYDKVADMNYNNEIFKISNISIIRVICMYWVGRWVCMRACMRACVQKNGT